MRYTIFKMGMLLGIVVVFAAGARPQKQATQEQKAEPQSQAEPSRPSGMMRGEMMRGGMMGGDASTMAEMRAIHELMVNHDRINRTVTNLTDGIRTVTESNDPEIAKTIQEHVLTMNQHVSAGNDPGLPMESPALHSIFRNADKVQTSIQTTANVVVVEVGFIGRIAIRGHLPHIAMMFSQGNFEAPMLVHDTNVPRHGRDGQAEGPDHLQVRGHAEGRPREHDNDRRRGA